MSTVVLRELTESILVLDKAQMPFVVETGQQGPQGIPSDAGFTAIAATDIGGHRIVTLNSDGKVEHADQATTAHYGKIVGISTGAASVGNTVTIRSSGKLTEPSWSWNPQNILFLGADGVITATPPSTGVLQSIGYAIDATTIFINITQSVEL